MSRPVRFDTIKNRFFKPRSDVTIGTQLGALALVCSPPFVFFLFGLVNQTINLTWNTLAFLFFPLVVLVPMILYIWSQQKRNTLTSEVGFCSHCGHQIPPGKEGELCLECGLAHHAENTPKSVIRKTPLLSWSIALFLALYIPWVVLMVATVNGGGVMRFTDKLGINVPAYLSTSMLVANAESDARGRSVAWTELQNRTLTTAQADRLAGTVLAYHEDPDFRSHISSLATDWLTVEIQKGTLSTPALTQALPHAEFVGPAITEFSVRTLDASEWDAFLEALFTFLDDAERSLGTLSDYTLNDWFDKQLDDGKLTPSQIERARACNWIPDLLLPERIRVDEPFEIIFGCGGRFGPFAELLSEPHLAVSVEAVAIDDGPFRNLGFESMIGAMSALGNPSFHELDGVMRVFPIELVISEPGPHVIRIRYQFFDGQRSEQVPSVARAADGSLLLPDGAGWILERVFEHTVVVEGD